jgi:hypothetical protein
MRCYTHLELHGIGQGVSPESPTKINVAPDHLLKTLQETNTFAKKILGGKRPPPTSGEHPEGRDPKRRRLFSPS